MQVGSRGWRLLRGEIGVRSYRLRNLKTGILNVQYSAALDSEAGYHDD
jgi:hypothetical protein